MKNILKNNLVIILLSVMCLTACQQDVLTYNDGYDDGMTPSGPPVITRITLAKDTAVAENQEIISGGSLASMISIYGENLSQVTSVKFNDVEADLKTIFAQNSRIVLPIPRVLPNEIDNKLTVTTSMGNVSTDFEVSIPDLIVAGFENEFATAGDTLKIVGENFDLYDLTEEKGKVTLGDRNLDILDADQNYVTIVMPEGIPDNTEIKVSGGKTESPISIRFRDSGISILTFEGLWPDLPPFADGTNEGDPKPPLGVEKFIRLNTELAAWSWNTIYGGGYTLYTSDINANPENYQIKFEVNTNKAISFGDILLGANAGEENYLWDAAEGGIPFHTNGKWRTVRIELQDTGWKPDSGWNGFSITYQPQKDANVDFSIANARIVKK